MWIVSSNTIVCLIINRNSHSLLTIHLLCADLRDWNIFSTSHFGGYPYNQMARCLCATLHRVLWSPRVSSRECPFSDSSELVACLPTIVRIMQLEGGTPHGKCSVPMRIAPLGRSTTVLCLKSHKRIHVTAPSVLMFGSVGLCSGSSVLCDYSWGNMNICLLTPDRKSMIDKRCNFV